MSCQYGRSAGLLLVVGVVTMQAGCGDGIPRGHPVEGKVVFKGKPGNMRQLAGGKVRFQSTSDPSIVAVGVIEDDGSFVLGTTINKKSVSGVPAGQYKARLEPRPADSDDTPALAPFAAKYLDYEKSGLTFTVPPPAEIVIEVERR